MRVANVEAVGATGELQYSWLGVRNETSYSVSRLGTELSKSVHFLFFLVDVLPKERSQRANSLCRISNGRARRYATMFDDRTAVQNQAGPRALGIVVMIAAMMV